MINLTTEEKNTIGKEFDKFLLNYYGIEDKNSLDVEDHIDLLHEFSSELNNI